MVALEEKGCIGLVVTFLCPCLKSLWPCGICLLGYWAPYRHVTPVTMVVDVIVCVLPWQRKKIILICTLWPSLTLMNPSSNLLSWRNSPKDTGYLIPMIAMPLGDALGLLLTALSTTPCNLYPRPISQTTLRYQECSSGSHAIHYCSEAPGLGLRWESPGCILRGGPVSRFLSSTYLRCFLLSFSGRHFSQNKRNHDQILLPFHLNRSRWLVSYTEGHIPPSQSGNLSAPFFWSC